MVMSFHSSLGGTTMKTSHTLETGFLCQNKSISQSHVTASCPLCQFPLFFGAEHAEDINGVHERSKSHRIWEYMLEHPPMVWKSFLQGWGKVRQQGPDKFRSYRGSDIVSTWLKTRMRCALPCLVYTVLVAAPFRVMVVLFMVLPLDACSVHRDGGHQTFGLVTTAAEARLETIFKLLAHKIESYWVYTWIHGCQVNSDVIHEQQKTKQFTSVLVHLIIYHFLQNTA